MSKVKPTSPQKYHPTHHGPEIFPRRRTFTPEEKQWREAAVSFLWERLQNNALDRLKTSRIADDDLI
ncbi:MAG: hypothetical protein JW953_12670 [Anaerolineae bacterium]|nr:hypothetical protein [Anaerolineae bacterium]